jgi:hypothetical protein
MSKSSNLMQDVRAALDRVAVSEEFRASPNLTAFLRFIVERTLDGREDTIKAYTVATEVLGRPESFDPQIDPIVRVEATRLRRSLERYYGRTADQVLITIPRGSYVPHFQYADETPETPSGASAREAAPASTARPLSAPARGPAGPGGGSARSPRPGTSLVAVIATSSRPVRFALFLAVLGLFSAGVTFIAPLPRMATMDKPVREQMAPTISALTTGEPIVAPRTRPALALTAFGTVLVAPVLETSPAGKVHAEIITDSLREALARYEDIVVVEMGGDYAGAQPSPSDDTYMLSGRLTRLGGTSKLVLRLRHEISQQIVWSAEYMVAVGDGPGLSETAMLRKSVVAIASTTGVIAGDIAAAKRRADPMSVPAACLLEAGAWLDPSRPERAELVSACLRKTVQDNPRFASGWAVLARNTLDRYRLGGILDPALLDLSLSEIMTAQALAPQSARAYQILSDILAARGDVAGANTAISRAVELNPNSADVLQSAAFRRIEAGDYAAGLRRLDEVAESGAPGSPWRSLFVAVALASVPGSPDRLANVQDPADHPAALLANMIARGVSGQGEAARMAARKLGRQYPSLADDPVGFLRRLGLGEAGAAALSRGLAATSVAGN